MSRGGRQDSGRDQRSSSPSPSFQRGGGGGRGGRFGLGYVLTSTFTQDAPPLSSASRPISRSPAVEELRRELEQKRTTGDQVTKAGTSPALSKAIRFVPRPGFGTAGRKCVVKANYFLVEIADRDLCRYDVTITPELISTKVNRDIISELVLKYRESHLGNRMPAYDGRKSLYTAGPLPFEYEEFVVKLIEKNNDAGSFGSTISFSASSNRSTQCLAVAVVASRILTEISNHHLHLVVPARCGGGRGGRDGSGRAGRGYNPAPTFNQAGPSRPSAFPPISRSPASAFHPRIMSVAPSQTPPQALASSSRASPSQAAASSSAAVEELRLEMEQKLSTGDQVTKAETPATSKAVRFTPRPAFGTAGKKCVIKANHFLVEIADRDLCRYDVTMTPEVASKKVKRYIISQLVSMYRESHLGNRMPAYDGRKGLYTAGPLPFESKEFVIKLVEENNGAGSSASTTKESHFQVAIKFASKADIHHLPRFLSGRQMDAPQEMMQVLNIVLRASISENYSTVGRTLFSPNFGPRDGLGDGIEYWRGYYQSLRPTQMGLSFNIDVSARFFFEPIMVTEFVAKYFSLKDMSRPLSEQEHIKLKYHETGGEASVVPRLGQWNMMNKKVVNGGRVEFWTCVNFSLRVNQNVPVEFCRQLIEMCVSKGMAGGRNTVLNDAIQRRIPLVTDVPTIIFGADITHHTSRVGTDPSIAAVCEVVYFSCRYIFLSILKYRLTDAGSGFDGLARDLLICRELCIAFRRATGHKPSRIIFYRDSVSEGKFSEVLLHEMNAIRKACSSLEEEYLPPVTYIAVQKRHHTRLFPVDRGETDRSGNILPGTVIDTKICLPSEFDFYLNSHAAIQGTSRPTHYHVLYDENHFTADGLQVLTNNLCYMNARCTRSVSIVPPVYCPFSCFTARYYIDGETSHGGSSGGRSTTGRSREVQPLPMINDNVQDVMFYC
ncbi:hypothetical protein GH714_001720 [Hevea brasiliensis]|uniref:Piwi domain-containing protein n=1 Tax=Hevea brasiliensis TaxID=3981 RepID=A0A6A6N6B3_HEVBR|nr:hypothetical protein GH714_001720 [Hevea brasiliensis]